jgi:hypothetical protein
MNVLRRNVNRLSKIIMAIAAMISVLRMMQRSPRLSNIHANLTQEMNFLTPTTMNVYYLNFPTPFRFTQLILRAFHGQHNVESLCQAKIAGCLRSRSRRVQDASAPDLVMFGGATGRLENVVTPTTSL